MTYREAIKILNEAPGSDKPSRINPEITVANAIRIVREAVESFVREGKSLNCAIPYWLEKRVYQVIRNQIRPRF